MHSHANRTAIKVQIAAHTSGNRCLPLGRIAASLFVGAMSCWIASAQTTSQVFSWNSLGMHCMDEDFSVFTILPPYNTVHAQIVVGTNGTARRVEGSGVQVKYSAILDSKGSINTTSIGKGNFWEYVFPMLGTTLAPDQGLLLPGFSPASSMPGSGNTPRPMYYEGSPRNWFVAWGIPITPYDDNLQLNPYPLMHIATSGGGFTSASTDTVLPVSVEMDCLLCHTSGAGVAARPDPDWEWNPVPARDYRLNIIRLHDQIRFQTMPTAYSNLLVAVGLNAKGLYASVVKSGHPVLCATCHLSESIPNSGQPSVRPLTQAIHGFHANVTDPVSGTPMGTVLNRSACYRCHPGTKTQCLRGAMGSAVDANAELAIQCQDCHGPMSAVGASTRTGWLDEPNCQACHTGDAVSNNGQIRYDNARISASELRVAVNNRFATNPNTPSAGHSLFRSSKGHGGLYCSACHGSTHAEFPSAFFNDNVSSMQRQGHVGQISECSACHGSTPSTTTGGPHGMHSLGWLKGHKTPGKTPLNCRSCHGTDYRGTVLARSFKNQTLDGQNFWRGRRIGCYECHNGASGDGNPPAAPTVSSRSASTTVNTPVAIALTASTSLLRVVTQPVRGMVGITGKTATYYPDDGFIGTETFTFCSDTGTRESNLGTVTVTVSDSGPCAFTLSTNLEFFDELSHVSEVQVTAGGGCEWSAASQTHWITLLSYSGPGSGSVQYTIARNTTSSSRMGYLTIAGKLVSIYQDGTPADANGDGIPDSWQMLYFMSANSTNAVPGLDYDHDGVSNLNEYLASTDPTEKSSALRITAFNLANAGPAYQLDFSTAPLHYYQVQRTANLLNPGWKSFTNAVIGTGATLPFTGTTLPNVPTMFYRIMLVN